MNTIQSRGFKTGHFKNYSMKLITKKVHIKISQFICLQNWKDIVWHEVWLNIGILNKQIPNETCCMHAKVLFIYDYAALNIFKHWNSILGSSNTHELMEEFSVLILY